MTVKFSVVIPTRERADTLHHCLLTCLAQDYNSYEIVVCDNCSSPATRQVVESLASPKIKYCRSPEPLAMSDNWDLAVSQASGEWVLVLGDDDALLSHALRELDLLSRKLDVAAIRWTAAYYTWPSIALPGQGNYLRLPLGHELKIVDARSAIQAVIAFQSCYTTLPMLYNAAIHRSLLQRLRQSTGRIFASRYPDVYSGFALGYLAERYASVSCPMSIAGASGHSYGIANLFLRNQSPLDEEFRNQNRQATLPTDRRVPDLPLFPYVPVADSFYLAKSALFLHETLIEIDRRLLTASCVKGICASDDEEWKAAMGEVERSLADDPELSAWFAQTFQIPRAEAIPIELRSKKLGYDGAYLHLDTRFFGIENVAEAARLCEQLLSYRSCGIEYGSEPPDREAIVREQLEEQQKTTATLEAKMASLGQELDRYRRLLRYPRAFYRALTR